MNRGCALILLLGALALPAFADDGGLGSWLGSEPQAQAYASARDAILGVVEQAAQDGVPVDLLAAKVKEGVSKHVPAPVLLNALRTEADRLALSGSLIDRYEGVVDPSAREKAIRRIGLLMAGGASVGTLQALLEVASRAQRGSTATVEALGVLDQATLTLQLPDPLVQKLGTSLLRSRMQEEVFASLPAMLLRARAAGLSANAAVDLVTSVMDGGGGLIQMQDQLELQVGSSAPPTASGSSGQGIGLRGNGSGGPPSWAGGAGGNPNAGGNSSGGTLNGNGPGGNGPPGHR